MMIYSDNTKAVIQDVSPSADQKALAEIQNRLGVTSENLGTLIGRLTEIVDCVFGSNPQKDQAGTTPRPVRMGTVGVVNDRLDDVSAQINALQDQINRLSKLA